MATNAHLVVEPHREQASYFLMKILSETGKWLFFVCILTSIAIGLAWASQKLGLTHINESSIFTRLSVVLTVFSSLALWVIRGWAEVPMNEGVRLSDAKKLRYEVRKRKIRMYKCLMLGVTSGVVLQIPAAILESANGPNAIFLSVVGYFCLLVMAICLIIALYDWHQQQETVAGLVAKSESDRKRQEELTKLRADDTEHSE